MSVFRILPSLHPKYVDPCGILAQALEEEEEKEEEPPPPPLSPTPPPPRLEATYLR